MPATRARRLAEVLVATVGLVVVGAPLPRIEAVASRPTARQTFRATTELVAVRTSVTRNGQPVRGLTANDFVVFDNGEPRVVEVVDAATVPIDIQVIVGQGSTAVLQQGSFAREIDEIPTLTQAGDRFGLTIVADNVVEIIPLGGARVAPTLPLRPGAGVTFDVVARALIAPIPAGRQRGVLVVATSIGTGALDYQAMLRLARSTPARLDVAVTGWTVTAQGMPGSGILRRRTAEPSWDYDERLIPTYQAWFRQGNDAFQRFLDQHLRDMRALAEATGGSALRWRRGSLRSAVTEALDQIREGYLLYFKPSVSTARGWQPIDVRVPSQKSLRITARAGYIR